jgi:tetratricopeptide (TPR) repeat protein
MGSKEVMVSAPVLVVLYDWTFSGPSLKELFLRRGRFYASLAATWIILAVLVFDSAGRGGSAGFGLGMTSWEYARTEFVFIIRYLGLAFWPHPLIMDYGDRVVSRPAEFIPAGLCVLSLVAATVWALASRRYRPIGFLGAWFFCILAPSSSVVPVITETGAEHRMYLPLAAVIALVVVAVVMTAVATCDRIVRSSPHSRLPSFAGAALLAPACLALVCVALGVVTVRRNVDYQSTLSIWRDTVEKCPDNWRALCNLGDEYASIGEFARATEFCDEAIRVKPTAAEPFSIRGAILMRLGETDRACRDFQRATEINPQLPAPHANLAIAHAAAGDLPAALSGLTTAISLTHAPAPYYWHRALVLMKLGRQFEAIDDLSEAIRLDPLFDRAWNARADCYRATQQLPKAIADLSQAIKINPRAPYYLNRGIALGIAGRFQESVDDCSAAVQLDPDCIEAYRTRALSNMNLKRYDLARADLAQMERRGSPPDVRLRERLEK